MNRIIKPFLLTAFMAAAALVPTSCTDYQDEVDALDYRVTVLESLVKEANTNLAALQTAVEAYQNRDYITNVTPTTDGYIITFAKAGAITILNGQDGPRGTDAVTPAISVALFTDGNYYWTLDGEWLLDANGQKVKANGNDGEQGDPGATGPQGDPGPQGEPGPKGTDAVTPQLRINDESYWEVSLDGGQTWTTTTTSCKGKDGADGTSTVISAVPDAANGYVTFTLSDGTTFRIPNAPLVYVESVTIRGAVNNIVTIGVGKTRQLSCQFTPANATRTDVIWYISEWDDPMNTYAGAIDINPNGTIHANSPCTVKVRAVAKFGVDANVYDEVTVVVE